MQQVAAEASAPVDKDPSAAPSPEHSESDLASDADAGESADDTGAAAANADPASGAAAKKKRRQTMVHRVWVTSNISLSHTRASTSPAGCRTR